MRGGGENGNSAAQQPFCDKKKMKKRKISTVELTVDTAEKGPGNVFDQHQA